MMSNKRSPSLNHLTSDPSEPGIDIILPLTKLSKFELTNEGTLCPTLQVKKKDDVE